MNNNKDLTRQEKQFRQKQKNLQLDRIQKPQKVKVLILTLQKIQFQDYFYLKKFINIIKLDLSYNKITSFPLGFSFKPFKQLKTLFLHYNKIQKLKHLEILSEVIQLIYHIYFQCNQLLYFTLFGNPLEQTLVRHFIVNLIPSLKLMDDKPVKEEQKYQGIFNLQNIQLNRKTDQKLGFPLVQINTEQNSFQFLADVMKQIKIVKQFYLKSNPMIKIQKWWKKIIINKQKYIRYLQNQTIIKQYQQNKSKQLKKSQKLLSQKQQIKLEQLVSLKNQSKYEIQMKKSQKSSSLKSFISDVSIDRYQKIFHIFSCHHSGIKYFDKLIYEQSSIFCTKKYCLQNNYKFNEYFTLKGKNVEILRLPIDSKQYNIQKESKKFFSNMIFYNNSHYVLEMKKYSWKLNKGKQRRQSFNFNNNKRQTNSINAFKKLIKNISDEKCIVELLEISKNQKISLITQEYHKHRISYLKNQKIQPFPFLFVHYILKISAAIKIQKHWKGYKTRNKFNALHIVKQLIAVKKIQKWLRSIKFFKRQRFLLNSYIFIKNNDTNNISMKLSTFTKLGQIYQKIMLKKYMILPFQNINFEIIEKNKIEILNNDESNDINLQVKGKLINQFVIKLRCQRQPFPEYFDKFYNKYQLSYNMPIGVNVEKKKNNIIDLLIKGSKFVKRFSVIKQQSSKIKQLLNNKQKQEYILFQYQTKQNANQRKLLLCLLIYDYLRESQIEFKSQKLPLSIGKIIDLNDKINQSYFIKMIYDNNKKQKLFEKIQKYTKQIKIKNNKIKWIPIKIRYFQSSNDYSAIFIIGKKYFKNQLHQNQKNHIENQNNLYGDQMTLSASRKKLKQLNSLKFFQNKSLLQKLDTDLGLVNISRSIISFNNNVNENSIISLKNQTGNNVNENSIISRNNQTGNNVNENSIISRNNQTGNKVNYIVKQHKKKLYQQLQTQNNKQQKLKLIDGQISVPVSQRYQNYFNQKYFNYINKKLLNKDISHTSLDISQRQSVNLNNQSFNQVSNYGSSLPLKLKKSQFMQINLNQQNELLQDSIQFKNSSIQSKNIQNNLLKMMQKKIFIQKLNNQHKMKIEYLSELRKKEIQMTRNKKKQFTEQNNRQILENEALMLLENIKKAKNIKNIEQKQFYYKMNSQRFQNHFLRKGNLSMRNQIKQFQKKRSHSNSNQSNGSHNKIENNKSKEKKQFLKKKNQRYAGQKVFNVISKDKNKNNIQQSVSVKRYDKKEKNNILKTQLKEFSIQLSSDSIDLTNLDNDVAQLNVLIKESRQMRKQKINSHNNDKRHLINSAASSKIAKLYHQKMQKLKSQQSEQSIYENQLHSISLNQKIVQKNQQAQRSNQSQHQDGKNINLAADTLALETVLKLKQLQKQRKKMMKKKKMVHSVFPQQFYPLKDSQQIGFSLPKINSNNK